MTFNINFTLLVISLSYYVNFCYCYNPYCSIHCGSHYHTVCRLEPCGLGWSCGVSAQTLPLTDTERGIAMDTHNELRQKLASGGDTRGGNSEAANMRAVSYDLELEFIAQCYANSCPRGHDKCRRTGKMLIGQNIYYSSGASDYDDSKYLKSAINMWYEEIKFTNAAMMKAFKFSKKSGHFTQLVWAATSLIGCGRAKTSAKSLIIICNYGVAGNVLGKSVYEQGKGCSACGSLTCNSKHAALCGESKLLKRFKPPFALSGNFINANKFVILTCLIINLIYFNMLQLLLKI